MYSDNQMSHVIQAGDSLYQLARLYQTTVQRILSDNPDIDPYNLQIGTTIFIYPEDESGNAQPVIPEVPVTPDPPPADPAYPDDNSAHVNLINDMRYALTQHAYWTRMFIISFVEGLSDLNDVMTRLMQNPGVIANVFANYYSPEEAEAMASLLTEHLQIGGNLITALKDGNEAQAESLANEWYANADKMADALSALNPYYNREELNKELYNHLEMTLQEAAYRISKNYPADIDAFNGVEKDILKMADYLSSGIIKQFPQRFQLSY